MGQSHGDRTGAGDVRGGRRETPGRPGPQGRPKAHGGRLRTGPRAYSPNSIWIRLRLAYPTAGRIASGDGTIRRLMIAETLLLARQEATKPATSRLSESENHRLPPTSTISVGPVV